KTAQHKHSFWEKYSPLTGFFGNFLLNYLNNDAKKIKAPSEKIVPPSEIAPEIISQFIAHQSKIIKTIESLENTDLTKSVITSPFAKIMTYRLDKTFEIAVAHEKRHIRQAERVLKMQRS
ncbi:MAG: hypothetical protein ABIP06_14780, partial [Pyrinomonadaceae bacterium]